MKLAGVRAGHQWMGHGNCLSVTSIELVKWIKRMKCPIGTRSCTFLRDFQNLVRVEDPRF